MSGPNVLACPKCGGPTAFQSPFCVYCRAPLTWGTVPALARGPILFHADVTKDPLPRRPATEKINEQRSPQGVEVTCAGTKSLTGELGPPRRHGCIVVRASTLDTHAVVGVVARRQTIPGACGYFLQVFPYYRTVQLTRYASTATGAYASAIHDSEFHPRVLGLGQLNEIELRCADSIFQVFVNGHHLATCIDAALGFGGFGWRVEAREASPARALIQSVTLYGVA